MLPRFWSSPNRKNSPVSTTDSGIHAKSESPATATHDVKELDGRLAIGPVIEHAETNGS